MLPAASAKAEGSRPRSFPSGTEHDLASRFKIHTRFFFPLRPRSHDISQLSSFGLAEVHPRRPGLGSPARSIPAHTQVLELERFACLPLLAFGSRPRPLVQLWLFTRHAAGVLDPGLVKQGLRPALLGGVREIHQSHTARLLHLEALWPVTNALLADREGVLTTGLMTRWCPPRQSWLTKAPVTIDITWYNPHSSTLMKLDLSPLPGKADAHIFSLQGQPRHHLSNK